jgi:hypothetical protein
MPHGVNAGQLVAQVPKGSRIIVRLLFFQNLRINHRLRRKQPFPAGP